jgi:hypothetical protein
LDLNKNKNKNKVRVPPIPTISKTLKELMVFMK